MHAVKFIAGMLCCYLLASTLADASPSAAESSYYWCSRGIVVHGQSVQYVTRINSVTKPFTTSLPDEAVGKAFMRHLMKTYSPDNRDELVSTSWNWNRACMTSWPYGHASLQEPHDRQIKAGAVEIDWVYTPDQDVADAPAPAPAQTQNVIPPECQHRANRLQTDICMRQYQQGIHQTTTAHNATSNPTPKSSVAKPVQTPVAPAAAAAAAATPYGICWADSAPRTKYYSALFDGSGADYTAWTQGFAAFLSKSYGFSGFARCDQQPNLANAKTYLQKMLDADRSYRLGDGSALKVIATDWKYRK